MIHAGAGAGACVAQKVVTPLEAIAQRVEAARAEMQATAKRLTSENKASVESVRRAQQRYFDAAAARFDAAKQANLNERLQRKAEEAADKEGAARREYEAIVEAARAAHNDFFSKELPDAMREAQRGLLEFTGAFGKLIAVYFSVSRDVPKRRVAMIDACM